jgi:photosystem II stability/assembly factor-like uncharacterized protein
MVKYPQLLVLSFIFIFFLPGIIISQSVSWQATNGPGGGNINTLAVQPNGNILAGSSTLGILVSSDNGESWMPNNNGLEFNGTVPGINTISVKGNGVLFAGTLRGVFRSTDDGVSWLHTSNGLPASDIGPHPVYELAFSQESKLYAAGLSGISISSDNGDTWSQSDNELSGKVINSLLTTSNNDIFAATNDDGIFHSSDGGETWLQKNNGLTELNSTHILSLESNSNGEIFAGTENGVYRSSDNANNWTRASQGMVNLTPVHSLEINAEGTIFAGTRQRQIYRSTDNGNSWERLQEGITISLINDITIAIDNNVYAATRSDGIFRSSNNGDSWTEVNKGIGATSVLTIAFNANQDIFVATEVRGIFRSTDAGVSWTQINQNLLNSAGRAGWVHDFVFNSAGDVFVAISPIPNAGGFSAGVFRSSNKGEEWIDVNNGLTGGCLALTINSNDILFAATRDAVFRSTDNGENWTEVNTGLPSDDVIVFSLNSSGDLFAGTDGSGVFRSTDNGDNWIEINNGLTDDEILSMAVNSAGVIFAGTTGGIFRSSDNGENWSKITEGFPSNFVDINGIAINSQDHVYAVTPGGTDMGVFVSTNNGDNWVSISAGLPVGIFGQTSSVFSVALNSQDEIFIGTDGAGVYKGDPAITSVESAANSLIKDYELAQNYPNPFNPFTTIRFSIPEESFVKLKIYNLLGQEVAALINGVEEAGEKVKVFDASGLPSGVYIYKITAGKFTDSKKMILIK